MDRDEQRAQLQEAVSQAFSETPVLYANGFINGVGLSDAYLILQANGRSVAVVNMPLAVVKTLAQNLHEMLNDYEQQSGERVPTLDELQKSSI